MGDKKQTFDFYNLIVNTRSVVNIFMLQAIAVVVVFIVWLAVKNNLSQSLMLHICFTTIGYGLLMTESILLFSGENFLGKTISRYHKMLIHGVFIGIGSVLAITGISLEIAAREADGWPHFSSIHAITGLTSMILMILACIGGLIAGHAKELKKFVPIVRPILWKISHNFIGQAAYAIGICSLCYGFDSWWFKLFATPEQKTGCLTICITVACWTLLGPMKTLFGYIKSLVV